MTERGNRWVAGEKTVRGLVLLLLVLLSGCAAQLHAYEDLPGPPLSVLFATDRQRGESSEPGEMFMAGRDSLRYGVSRVSFPADHELAELESPVFTDDPEEHVLLYEVSLMSEESFTEELQAAAYRGEPVLVYIHGFNMTFEKAVRHGAQLVHDMGFTGTAVLFSWPSEGKVSRYPADETAVVWARPHLERVLENVALAAGTGQVALVAHSMGNRVLTAALAELLERRPELKGRFASVILHAPDIDSEVFRRDIAPGLLDSGALVTLYASAEDKALKVSQRLHRYSRAGYIDGHPLVIEGMETVDAGCVSEGGYGHSYYRLSRPVLSDMYYLVNRQLPAAERFSLEPVESPDGVYWRFQR
ncbi:alpha/beta hydrolase [Prosthecochloris sp. ZM_2]|uniref:alpha/beta hydrolase n=1 Tax=Prosthecochloris sp. ZM_2 TaxID=2045206 RepID=UPI000DF782B3|nr:alpha/beta hydrolase [Prosthecochloris sp. ZM_2]RNA64377.1 alpha/beta hydrolase [Prosthecochloris sp. ZM_2]